MADDELTALGESAERNRGLYEQEAPNPDILEAFPNPDPTSLARVELSVKSHTSLCPRTGQPDYAKIHVEYTPDQRCLETKSLKLYLMGFRNHGSFCETTACTICNALVEALDPKFVAVEVTFEARGDIEITGSAQYPSIVSD